MSDPYKMTWTKWNMSFNVNKCMVVSVTLKRIPIQADYILHGRILTAVKCAKSLGVSIDSELRFNQHFDNLCKKATIKTIKQPKQLNN